MSLPISGFTAVPNPQMLAFMATQSFLMMQMAGAGWQYGKRKISAMSNIEFNKLSTNQLLSNETADVRKAIPTIEASMNDMTALMAPIVAQYADFIKEAIKGAGQGLTTLLGGTGDQTQVQVGSKLGVASFITPLLAEIKRLQQIQESQVGQTLVPTEVEIVVDKTPQQIRIEESIALTKSKTKALERLSKQRVRTAASQVNQISKDIQSMQSAVQNQLSSYRRAKSQGSKTATQKRRQNALMKQALRLIGQFNVKIAVKKKELVSARKTFILVTKQHRNTYG